MFRSHPCGERFVHSVTSAPSGLLRSTYPSNSTHRQPKQTFPMPASPAREESGLVSTLLRSEVTLNTIANGNVPLCIPPVTAPATSLLPRPPVYSAPHIRDFQINGSALNPSLFRLRRHREESGWLCRVFCSASLHLKPRNTPYT